jgi:hypothetical protein
MSEPIKKPPETNRCLISVKESYQRQLKVIAANRGVSLYSVNDEMAKQFCDAEKAKGEQDG